MMRLETERLIIRNWEERDRELFHRINSDDDVMQFFPFRRSRAEADAFLDRIRAENEARGYGFSALELKQGGACIGFAGLHADNVAPSRPADAVEIGWRLAPEFWGKGYVSEAAEALLAFGFEELGLNEIISFAVWNNDRSTAVMRRIGMTRDLEADFDHPRVPDTYPQLKRHVLYSLKRQDWASRR